MLFKSNANLPFLGTAEISFKSFWISLALHIVVASLFLLLFFMRPKPREEIIISVLDSPVVAPTITSIAKPIPKKETQAQPHAVFGVSKATLTAGEGLEVKAGNTIAKTPDAEILKPNDPDTLPVPTDDYLVSEMPKLESEVRIPYPPQARQRGVQGAVVMDILIDASGKVRDAKLLEGPGFGLNEAALAAVKGFVFKPARMQNQAVTVRIRYAYRFILERN